MVTKHSKIIVSSGRFPGHCALDLEVMGAEPRFLFLHSPPLESAHTAPGTGAFRRRVVRVEAGAVSQTSAFAEIPCAWEQSQGAPSAMTHCGKMSTTLKSGMWQKWAQGDERGLL